MAKNETGSSSRSLLRSLNQAGSLSKPETEVKPTPEPRQEPPAIKQPEAVPEFPNPAETAARVRELLKQKAEADTKNDEFLYKPAPAPLTETRNELTIEGNTFKVKTREKRRVRKCFLLSEKISKMLNEEAQLYDVSLNELLNQILEQHYFKESQ